MKKAVIILTVALIISLAGNIFQFVYTSGLTSKLSAENEKTAELEASLENLKSEIERIREDGEKSREAAENELTAEQERTAELKATVASLAAEIKSLESLSVALDDSAVRQSAILSSTAEMYVEDVLNGKMTLEDCENLQNSTIDIYITENVLPQNGLKLLTVWKIKNDWYKQFEGLTSTQKKPTEKDNTDNKPSQQQQKDKKEKEKQHYSSEMQESEDYWNSLSPEEQQRLLDEVGGGIEGNGGGTFVDAPPPPGWTGN